MFPIISYHRLVALLNSLQDDQGSLLVKISLFEKESTCEEIQYFMGMQSKKKISKLKDLNSRGWLKKLERVARIFKTLS